MVNSVITTIFTEHSGEIDILINAEHPDNTIDFNSAGVYSIWNSNNDPLGLFSRKNDSLTYEGDMLNENEQMQVSDFIKNYREGDWDL